VYPKESIRAVFPVIINSFISVYLIYLLKDITNGLQLGFDNDLKRLILLF
jgi:hypothetical protein